MNNTKISAPRYTFVRELTAMFEADHDIKIEYDDDNQTLNIKVNKYEKAEALRKLLPASKEWGELELKINIKYDSQCDTIEDVIKQAFKNNPAFRYVFSFQTDTNPITYVIFDKKVVQYWNDDLHDPHGITSTLYEDIARHIFNSKNGLVFSTYSEENILNKSQPTNEEIATWEKYNGKGSYSNGSSPKSNKEEPIHVKDKETFKAVFNYFNDKKKKPFIEKEEEFPF